MLYNKMIEKILISLFIKYASNLKNYYRFQGTVNLNVIYLRD